MWSSVRLSLFRPQDAVLPAVFENIRHVDAEQRRQLEILPAFPIS